MNSSVSSIGDVSSQSGGNFSTQENNNASLGNLGENGTLARQMFNENTENFDLQFNRYYDSGKSGIAFEDVPSLPVEDVIDNSVAFAAHSAGVNDALLDSNVTSDSNYNSNDIDTAKSVTQIPESVTDNAINVNATGIESDALQNEQSKDIMGVESDTDATSVSVGELQNEQKNNTSKNESVTVIADVNGKSSFVENNTSYVGTPNSDIHTSEQIKTINEYKNSTNNKIVEFVKKIFSISDTNARNRQSLMLSEVSSNAVSDIKEVTGVDTTGFSHNIKGNTVAHIGLRHGVSGEANRSMANVNDLARVEYVIQNYDTIDKADTSTGFRNSDGTWSKSVVYSKKLDGTYYVVEAVPDTKAKQLQIVSAYMTKGDNQVHDVKSPSLTSETKVDISPFSEGNQVHDVKSPSLTSETELDISSNESVSNNGANVNDFVSPTSSNDQAVRASESNGSISNSSQKAQATSTYYNAGMTRLGIDKVHSKYGDLLTDSEKQAAYDKGTATVPTGDTRASSSEASGLVMNNNAKNNLSKSNAKILNSIAKKLGVNIKIVDTLSNGFDANGFYNPNTNTIEISTSAENPLMEVAIHEITHRMQDLAPASYNGYRNYAVNFIAERSLSPMDSDGIVQDKIAQYKEQGIDITAEQAMDEIAAEFTGILIEDGTLFESLAQDNRSLARKILDSLKDFISKVKSIITSDTRSDYFKDLEDVQKAWEYAYDAAKNGNKTVQKNTARNSGEVKYSVKYTKDNTPYVDIDTDILAGVPKENWVKTVKDNLRNKFPDGITVGNNVVAINQKSRLEMTLSNYVRRLIQQEPEIYGDKLRSTDKADEIIKATTNWVNEALVHPRKDNIKDFARGEVLLRLGDNEYTAEVIVGNKGNNNLLLYDIINLKSTKIKEVDSPVIRQTPKESTYRQENTTSKESISQDKSDSNSKNSLKNGGTTISKSELLYLDKNKKRTDSWFNAVGLQLPSVAKNQYGSIGNISYDNGKINISGVPFKENFTEYKNSLKNGGTTSRELTRLSRENDLLRERISYFKGQTKITKVQTVDTKSTAKVANKLLKDYGSNQVLKKTML